ncbi:hypothetical protein LIER_19573 [Lithospermum erythrorhizon]|uniref:Uncharacterized protein n=1 Tax=Lithospermum erythrorhizon TaxID=34254 RepID=A0AAV3QM14_LITER
MVSRLRCAEKDNNFCGIQFLPNNFFFHSSIMTQDAQVYTLSIFKKKIHNEFEIIHAYYCEHLVIKYNGNSKNFYVYKMENPIDPKSRIDKRSVVIDFEEKKISLDSAVKGGLDFYADLPSCSSNEPSVEQKYQQVCLYMNGIASRVCMFDEPYKVFLNDIMEAGKRAELSI